MADPPKRPDIEGMAAGAHIHIEGGDPNPDARFIRDICEYALSMEAALRDAMLLHGPCKCDFHPQSQLKPNLCTWCGLAKHHPCILALISAPFRGYNDPGHETDWPCPHHRAAEFGCEPCADEVARREASGPTEPGSG